MENGGNDERKIGITNYTRGSSGLAEETEGFKGEREEKVHKSVT